MAALSRCLCAGALAWLASGATGVRGERVVERIVEHIVERSFQSKLTLATTSYSLTMDEEGRSTERDGVAFERELRGEQELVDTCEDPHEPPEKFTRLYRSVASHLRVGGQGEPKEEDEHAPVEGQRVTFQKNAGGAYERHSDGDLRKPQLMDLRVDLSLERLLPPADLARGESWTVAFEDLAWLLSPAVDLARRPQHDRMEVPEDRLVLAPSLLRDPAWLLFSGAEGEAKATDEPAAEGEKTRRAKLRFRFENTRAGAMADLIGPQAEVEDEVHLRWEGEGTLTWDEPRTSVRLELSGEIECEETFHVTLDRDGKSASILGKLVGSGALELEADQRPGS